MAKDMKPVKLGFIGAGGIAQSHMRALSGVQEIEVVAVADIVQERAEQTAQQWKIPHVYQDYREMLAMEDVEAVSVCTYNQAHRAPTVDALRAGKHVMVEKPMAATLDDAAAMTQAAHETGQILMVAVWTRFSPPRQAAKAIVDAGTLGDIYYAEAVAARRWGMPGGSFIRQETAGLGTTADIGVYCLDEALHLMGHPKPISVSAIANNRLSKEHYQPVFGVKHWGGEFSPDLLGVEDFGVAWVRFEDGAVLVFKTCWAMHMDSMGGTFVLGTRAGLKLNPLTVFHHEWGMITDTMPQNVPPTEPQVQFRQENVAFAQAIREGLPSPIPPEQLLLTNVIIQGLMDSASAGCEVQVSVPNV
jgi:predicted dehydrogenase